MARLRRFTISLASGYGAMVISMVLTLWTVPLALHYLSAAKFGLWAVLQQLMSYSALIDFGLSNSISRLLVDHKDTPEDGRYGGLIRTALTASILQGAAILIAGLLLAGPVTGWLNIPPEQREEFTRLLHWSATIVAGTFFSRITQHILFAHQRMDVINCLQIGALILNTAVLWLGLVLGWGLYAFVISQAVGWLFQAVTQWLACLWLQLLPRTNQWGKLTWAELRASMQYSRDVFLLVLGFQFINASQAIIISHQLGLETVTVWSICTKVANLLSMIICRITGYASPAFAEMIARGEQGRLLQRFRETGLIMVSAAVFGALGLSVCNSAFVTVWTHGRISWNPVNDVLLGGWLIFQVINSICSGFIPLTKRIGYLGITYLVEAGAFVTLAMLVLKHGTVTDMLLVSLACTLLFSVRQGIVQSARYFGLSARQLILFWFPPVARFTLLASLAVFPAWLLARSAPPLVQLLTGALVCLLTGVPLWLRLCIGDQLWCEMQARTPAAWHVWLRRLSLNRGVIHSP